MDLSLRFCTSLLVCTALAAMPPSAEAQAKAALVRSVNAHIPPPILVTPPYVIAGSNSAYTATLLVPAGSFTTNCTAAGGTIVGAATGRTIQFLAGATPGIMALICSQSDGPDASPLGYTTIPVLGLPVTPTVIVQPTAALGSQGVNASVIARPGYVYNWTIGNGMFTNIGGAAGHFVGNFNAITFAPTSSGTVALTCVESLPNGEATSSPGAATVTIP